MKNFILSIIVFCFSFITQAQGQYDYVQLGIDSDSTHLYLDIKTNFNIDSNFGIMTSVMTIRWKTQLGVIVDSQNMQLYDPSWWPITDMWFLYAPLKINGQYSYQTFITSGTFYGSTIEIDSSTVYHFLKIPYYNNSDSCIKFEVVDDQFQEDLILCNCSWWMSILHPTMNFPAGTVDATYMTFLPDRYIVGRDRTVVDIMNCLVLPVELIEFNGKNINFINELKWATATENENSHFDIERSEDIIEWNIIGTVYSSEPNSSVRQDYLFHDGSYKEVINYYRLKQVDMNGTVKYFGTISIDNTIGVPLTPSKRINAIGQEVYQNYRGVVIEQYKNSFVKKIKIY
jgi:hypothetical protein